MIKILVFPCGSEVGLEIHNALKWSTHIELYGSSTVSNHGKLVYKNYIEGVPHVDSDDFLSGINLVIEKYKIDFIFPAYDSVIVKLAQFQDTLKCKVIGSPLETAQICRSKKQTYNFFKGIVEVPKVYESGDSIEQFPVFLKPEVGQGSKGVFIAYTKDDVLFYLKKDPTLLILEYLPGKEYTIDCFTDRKGALRFVGSRERVRISGGISVATRIVNDNRFEAIAKIINEKLSFRGVWFFQVKENKDGELSLLEIAPRVAGSMGLYRNRGINLALLSVFDALDKDVEVMQNTFDIFMDRALYSRFVLGISYKHVYIDFDDTIVCNGALNPFVMAFLFQVIGQGGMIHLLSRHKIRTGEELNVVLRKYKIRDIFDEVVDIAENEKKSDFVIEGDAIFIDDSFSERKDVFERKGIPVFEVSAIESLIDWKY